jgi:hypothetical protein
VENNPCLEICIEFGRVCGRYGCWLFKVSFVFERSLSRVFHGVHSLDQVVVGAFAGGIFALLWFFVTQWMLRPLFPTLQSLPICQYFYIYDGSVVDNQLAFEYECYNNVKKQKKVN